MRLGLLSVLLLALLGLSSCGDDGPLTESEYRAAGNELCENWSGEISELSANASSGSERDLVEFSLEAGRLSDDYTERLLNLSPPESLAGDRAALQALLSSYQSLIDEVPESEAEFDAITDTGNAISEALSSIWSACRN